MHKAINAVFLLGARVSHCLSGNEARGDPPPTSYEKTGVLSTRASLVVAFLARAAPALRTMRQCRMLRPDSGPTAAQESWRLTQTPHILHYLYIEARQSRAHAYSVVINRRKYTCATVACDSQPAPTPTNTEQSKRTCTQHLS